MGTARLWQYGLVVLCLPLTACDREVSYSADVAPILASNCVECHAKAAEGVARSGLNLEDYDSLMSGTQFGQVVVPGSPESSTLYLVVAHKTAPEIHMPPHHEKAFAEGRGSSLTEDQIEVIHAWIAQGAPDN